ncbi:unnamed protein product, partial [Ectocarpus sp. 4 AP-2014]
CGSWTAAAVASSKRQPRAIPHVGPLPTTAHMKLPLVRSMSSLQFSKWEREGLPVAPVYSGSEPPPSNLKLAAEAWPGATAGEGGDTEEDAEEEETDPLSEADHDAIAALLDMPGLAATNDLEVEVVAWADGAPVATVSLAPSVFGVPVRRDVVHEVVRWQLARRRKGNGQTKRIGEISGSGRKVRPQKGGGVARAGHSRPPHWRGGAKAHGPRRRDFSFKLNKKFVRLGLRVALSARLREGQLKVVDDLKSDGFRTSAMIKTIKVSSSPTPNCCTRTGALVMPLFLRHSRDKGTAVLHVSEAEDGHCCSFIGGQAVDNKIQSTVLRCCSTRGNTVDELRSYKLLKKIV